MGKITCQILSFLLITASCYAPNSIKKENSWTVEDYKKGNIQIFITNHNLENFTIDIHRSNETIHLDLNELKIPFKTPGTSWINQNFICISTWWSGPFQNAVFIPITGVLGKPIYIENVQLSDSLTNTVVYVDTVSNSSCVMLFAENLRNRRKKSIKVDVHTKRALYPYYDSLTISNSNLMLRVNGNSKIISLQEIK